MEGKYPSWGQAAKQVPQAQLGPGRQTSTSAGARPPNEYLSWGQAAKQAADRHELRSLVSDLVINRQEDD